MKQYFLFSLLLFACLSTAQTIQGQLTSLAGKTIDMYGFEYMEQSKIGSATADDSGVFEIKLEAPYKGVAYMVADGKNAIINIQQDDIQMLGAHLAPMNELRFVNSPINSQWQEVLLKTDTRSNVISGWMYMKSLYSSDPEIVDAGSKQEKFLDKELERLIDLDNKDFNSIKDDGFSAAFLKARVLIRMNNAGQSFDQAQIAALIQQFREYDFAHPFNKHTGIPQQLVTSHLGLLMQNSPKDKAVTAINESFKSVTEDLMDREEELNEMTKFLYDLLLKNQLTENIAHLSNLMLNDNSCALEQDVTDTLKKFEHLAVGKKAPDLQLTKDLALSDINEPVLLVYGASWCPHCQDALAEMRKIYPEWKAKNKVKVVYISLDKEQEEYNKAYGNTPWTTYTDLLGWESPHAKAYMVRSTPSYFLLDQDLRILSHPFDLSHANELINKSL